MCSKGTSEYQAKLFKVQNVNLDLPWNMSIFTAGGGCHQVEIFLKKQGKNVLKFLTPDLDLPENFTIFKTGGGGCDSHQVQK